MKQLLYRISIIFLFIFLAFSEKIFSLLNITLYNGIRQIVLFIFCLFLFIINKSDLDKKLIYLLLSFIFFSFLNIIFIPNSFFAFLYGLFSTTFFIIMFIFCKSIFLNLKSIKILFNYILFIIFISSIISLLSIPIENDFRLQFTLFRELGAYGVALVYAILLSLTMNFLTRNQIYIFLAIFFLFCIFTTLLKKSIFDGLLIIFIFIYYRYGTVLRLYFTTIISIFVLIFLVYVGSDFKENVLMNIEYYTTTKSEGVRQIMYVAAIYLATINFPFGSGMGTFGTPASLINGYNNTYYQTGISEMSEMSPDLVMNGKPNTLFDTFWPHIIGESGYFGTILFLILWFYPLYYISKHLKKNNINTKFVKYYILSSTIIMTIDGFTLFVPEIPLFIMLHILFSSILYNYSFKTKI